MQPVLARYHSSQRAENERQVYSRERMQEIECAITSFEPETNALGVSVCIMRIGLTPHRRF